jgi:hypothetical protein
MNCERISIGTIRINHVDDPDEEHQRGDVREPGADRLGRQALLGDLHLRDLVDRLAEGVALAVLLAADLDAHQEEPEQDRQERPQHDVGDGLVDREVEAAEMDRHPVDELELLVGLEAVQRQLLAGRQHLVALVDDGRDRGRGRRVRRAGCQSADGRSHGDGKNCEEQDQPPDTHHFSGPPKYVITDTPSSME